MHRGFMGFSLWNFTYQLLRQHQVFDNGHMREQVEALKHHANLAPYRINVFHLIGQLIAIYDDLACIVFFQPVDTADQG